MRCATRTVGDPANVRHRIQGVSQPACSDGTRDRRRQSGAEWKAFNGLFSDPDQVDVLRHRTISAHRVPARRAPRHGQIGAGTKSMTPRNRSRARKSPSRDAASGQHVVEATLARDLRRHAAHPALACGSRTVGPPAIDRAKPDRFPEAAPSRISRLEIAQVATGRCDTSSAIWPNAV